MAGISGAPRAKAREFGLHAGKLLENRETDFRSAS
jgi:hypothetical protein